MSAKTNRALLICAALLTTLFTCGCNGTSAVPNSGGGTTKTKGATYSGSYNTIVHDILKRYEQHTGVTLVYPTSATDPNISKESPDTITTLGINANGCIRDTYVGAAVAAAWAAEAHARIGNPSAAQDNAVNDMLPQLIAADQLCSNTPVVTTGASTSCITDDIWGCQYKGTEKP